MAEDKKKENGGFENKSMQDLSKAFEKATSMPTVPTPEAAQGKTTFAKEDPQYNNK